MKRKVAILLAVIMVLSMIPMNVFGSNSPFADFSSWVINPGGVDARRLHMVTPPNFELIPPFVPNLPGEIVVDYIASHNPGRPFGDAGTPTATTTIGFPRITVAPEDMAIRENQIMHFMAHLFQDIFRFES